MCFTGADRRWLSVTRLRTNVSANLPSRSSMVGDMRTHVTRRTYSLEGDDNIYCAKFNTGRPTLRHLSWTD